MSRSRHQSRSRPHTGQPRSRHQGMSRHRFLPLTKQARSRPQNDVATPSSTGQVATSIPCRDLLDDQAYVATSSSCRDLNSPQARSRRQFHVATSWRLTYVATSFPCRDLPHCRPCRDLKMMSRHQLSSAPFLLHRDAMS